MEGLFAKEWVDLGPWGLDATFSIPSLTRIHGSRPAQLLREIRQLCPGKPGIYGMVDAGGTLIYIGKAKNLRVRLFSYFRSRGRPPKAGKIVRQTSSIVWELCQSEFAALHRELELIRRWRPRWNVQGQPLRRQLTFLCVGRKPAPYVFLARKPPRNALAIHGPLPAGLRTQEAVRRLNDLFRLRDCPQAQEMIFPEQGELFPIVNPAGCLRFEIGTCSGPCTGTCSHTNYQKQVRAVRDFLTGRDLGPLQKCDDAMQAAAEAQNFELAALLRDRLGTLRWLTQRLEWLRQAREKMSFIYPMHGWDHTNWWYLIHGGRTLAALPEPQDLEARRSARKKIEEVYRGKKLALVLDSYEHIDSMVTVSSWFRKYPEEMKKVYQVEEALRLCQK